ncbi:MAG: hypothetical protein M3209_02820 [Acidobacteriota bacterium]|nr:hypothetical protein [Acidobacteriota bacterium]
MIDVIAGFLRKQRGKNDWRKRNYPTNKFGRTTTGVRVINERKPIGNVVCVNIILESKRGQNYKMMLSQIEF